MKVQYKFYATLLDSFAWYLSSESDDAFKEFIGKLNGVKTRSEAADKGIALNTMVDEVASGALYPARQKDGHYRYQGYEFACDVVDYMASTYRGAFSQHYTEAVLETRKGNVLLYGFVDEILPGETHDIKGTGEYEYPSYLHGWQKIVYPFCLEQQGIHCPDFTYMITDYDAVYREDYRYDPERDIPKLVLFCEELIDFIETHRKRILNKKLFALDPPKAPKKPSVYVRLMLDQISAFNKKGTNDRTQYAKQGEKVEVLSDHGNVLIVDGANGPFPVKKSETISINP